MNVLDDIREKTSYPSEAFQLQYNFAEIGLKYAQQGIHEEKNLSVAGMNKIVMKGVVRYVDEEIADFVLRMAYCACYELRFRPYPCLHNFAM